MWLIVSSPLMTLRWVMATAFLCGCLGCYIKSIGKSVYVKNFIEEDLVNFRAKAKEVAE